MSDLLLELRSEEIPARMQDGARAELARRLTAELAKAGLAAASIETCATPRRLAAVARGLPGETASVSDEIKGPRASAPPQALEGFLRKTGLARQDLVERDGVLFAVIDKPGRATLDVLAEAIPAVVRGFAWPKSMRWGAASISTESLRWVRPLQGIVALFDGEIVPCAVDGIVAGAESVGHRFHHPGPITFAGVDDYVAKLRACHVIVDQDERKAIIRDRAAALAAEAGLSVIEDEALVAENAGLTEWPVPLLGRFDPAFLEVPPEVIRLTMRTNQRYFALSPPRHGEVARSDGGGVTTAGHSARAAPPLHHASPGPPPRAGEELAPAFICTANIDAPDGGAKIAAGNAKVLAARLADARFFWDQDLRVPLEAHAEKLGGIVFHEKLGTVADKVERVAKLARWLCEEGIVASSPAKQGRGTSAAGGGARRESARTGDAPLHHSPEEANGPPPPMGEELATLAERAARLCKADLVTAMVGEFPELQGVIGGYYAAKQGEHPQVAAAIRDHYKPVGQGDAVPTAPVTVAVSLADKLDTICSFFGVALPPSGSKDPFALRRAALGIVAQVHANSIRLPLRKVVRESQRWLAGSHAGLAGSDSQLLDFFADRLKVQQREAGVRHDLIDAVFALGGEDDLVRLLARVKALQAFVETDDGANLLAAYKRAANILKKSSPERGGGPAKLVEGHQAVAGARDVPLHHASHGPPPPAEEDYEDGIPKTGEEDPLSLVEQLPDLSAPQKPLSYSREPAETALVAALDSAEPLARAAIEREEFEGAMRALASLRAPIDAFFDEVTVNDPDPARREARLALLARVRAAIHQVADFSKIEG